MSGPAEEFTAALREAERLILHVLPNVLEQVATAARAVLAQIPDTDPHACLAEQVLGPPGYWVPGDEEPPNPVGMRVRTTDGRVWVRRATLWAHGLATAEWPELTALGLVEEVRGD